MKILKSNLFSCQRFIYLILLLTYLSQLICCEKTITFCYKNPECTQLNDMNFQQKWPSLEKELFEVNRLNVYEISLNQSYFIKILNHSMPQIRILDFHYDDELHVRNWDQIYNVLSVPLMQTILQSEYFSKLQVLDLSRTLLNYRHFQVLENWDWEKTVSLKSLKLWECSLEKRAFTLLSKLNFRGKLQLLMIAKVSLIDSDSVDSVIKMIKPENSSHSNLKNLSLFDSSISAENLIQILESIDLSQLQSLNIGMNALQHSKHYSIPFNNTIYEYLAAQNFSSLKRLALGGLDLDNEQLTYLKNWKLPFLKELILTHNFITDDYFKEFVTKENIPLLERLQFGQSDVTDLSVKYVYEQNFQFLHTICVPANRRFTAKYIEYLALFDSKKLVELDLSSNKVSENSLKMLFEDKNFSNLQILSIQNVKQAKNLFSIINWKSMEKLKYLFTKLSDTSTSFININNLKMTFPSLKQFVVGGNWINNTLIMNFLERVGDFGPQLELVKFSGNSLSTCLQFQKLKPSQLPEGIYLESQLLRVRKILGKQKLQLITITMSSNFFTSNFKPKQFPLSMIAQTEVFDISYLDYDFDVAKKISDRILAHLDIMNVQIIQANTSPSLIVFKQLFFGEINSKRQIKQHQDFTQGIITKMKYAITLPYLTRMDYIDGMYMGYYQNLLPPFLYFINKIKTPILSMVNIQGWVSDSQHGLVQKKLRDNQNIKDLRLINGQFKCQAFEKFFNDLNLPYLVSFISSSNQIEMQKSSCPVILQIFKKQPILKFLDFSYNQVEVISFINAISQSNLFLQTLILNSVKTEKFDSSQIKMNMEFLNYLGLKESGFTSDNLLEMTKNSTQILFPKLNYIDLGQIKISEEALTSFLASGVPFLRMIEMKTSENPNFANNLLSYPSRIQKIVNIDDLVYGFKQEIDPRSTRYLSQLILQSQNIIADDFKTMQKCNMLYLNQLSLVLHNVFECEILQSVLKMASNIQHLQFVIDNEKTKGHYLDEKCLQNNQKDQHNKYQFPNLQQIYLDWIQQQVYIPKFVSYLYGKGQTINALLLESTLIGDEGLINICQNGNLQGLSIALLSTNLLSDTSMTIFFELPLTQIVAIELKNNMITQNCFKNFQGKNFEMLQMIDLSSNPLTDKGIEYFSKAHYPLLVELILSNLDITKISMKYLSDLDAPNLNYLALLNNKFTEDDLVYFFQHQLNTKKFQQLGVIQTNVEMSQNNFKKIKSILRESRIQLQVQTYKVKAVNSAKMINY